MIEIKADEFANDSILEEHVYIDENKISMISTPKFYDNLKRFGGKYIGVWKFSIVIDGSSQGFSYVSEDICNQYYQVAFKAFMSNAE